MSLQPHRLSSCCGVPIMGNENSERSICSKCKQPCAIDVVDDGERTYLVRMMAIKRRSIEEVSKRINVTGFNRAHEKITVEFNDHSGARSQCTINNNDFFNWASANSYLALLPEVEYVDGEHWDKQPHHINKQLNVTERVRFYNSIDKNMLENYLNEKIPLKRDEGQGTRDRGRGAWALDMKHVTIKETLMCRLKREMRDRGRGAWDMRLLDIRRLDH